MKMALVVLVIASSIGCKTVGETRCTTIFKDATGNEAPKLHSLSGPAFYCNNGAKRWFVDGESFSEDEFNNHPKVIEETIRKNKILDERPTKGLRGGNL